MASSLPTRLRLACAIPSLLPPVPPWRAPVPHRHGRHHRGRRLHFHRHCHRQLLRHHHPPQQREQPVRDEGTGCSRNECTCGICTHGPHTGRHISGTRRSPWGGACATVHVHTIDCSPNYFTPNYYCIHGACVGDGELVVRGTGRWSDLGPDLLAVQSNRGGCAVDCWQCSLFCCPFSPSVGGAVRSVGNAVHQSAVCSVSHSARSVGGVFRSVGSAVESWVCS